MNTVSSDKTRIRALDVLRGLTVLSMVAFHTAYDLAYIFELPVPWFTSGPVQDIWRNSISWTFLFLAGWMCAYSRNNFKRAIRYGAFAILIWFATTLAAVDTPINFGIIYCMSVSTLIAALLRHVTKGKLNSKSCLIAAAACLVLFFATYGLFKQTYATEYLAWLGFPSSSFASGDYYPLIPFSFMYLCGAFAHGHWIKAHQDQYPTILKTITSKPIEWIGRHSLLIYALHQPLILLILQIVISR